VCVFWWVSLRERNLYAGLNESENNTKMDIFENNTGWSGLDSLGP
jgi:hypothetical protein